MSPNFSSSIKLKTYQKCIKVVLISSQVPQKQFFCIIDGSSNFAIIMKETGLFLHVVTLYCCEMCGSSNGLLWYKILYSIRDQSTELPYQTTEFHRGFFTPTWQIKNHTVWITIHNSRTRQIQPLLKHHEPIQLQGQYWKCAIEY